MAPSSRSEPAPKRQRKDSTFSPLALRTEAPLAHVVSTGSIPALLQQNAPTETTNSSLSSTITSACKLPSPMARWICNMVERESLGFDSDSAETTDSEEDHDCSDDEQENLMVQALVKAAFNPKSQTPALSRFVGRVEQPSSLSSTTTKTPSQHLRDILRSASIPYRTHAASTLSPGFFMPLTHDYTQGYSCTIEQAIRNDDIPTLTKTYAVTQNLDVGTKTGDSIVHAACRRQSMPVLTYLLREANVSCRHVNAVGKTPLHEACFTTTPNFELIALVLDECLDLLYVTEQWGKTPLDYVPASAHTAWCDFLDRRGASGLAPKEL